MYIFGLATHPPTRTRTDIEQFRLGVDGQTRHAAKLGLPETLATENPNRLNIEDGSYNGGEGGGKDNKRFVRNTKFP